MVLIQERMKLSMKLKDTIKGAPSLSLRPLERQGGDSDFPMLVRYCFEPQVDALKGRGFSRAANRAEKAA
jgi:hypothetical protein